MQAFWKPHWEVKRTSGVKQRRGMLLCPLFFYSVHTVERRAVRSRGVPLGSPQSHSIGVWWTGTLSADTIWYRVGMCSVQSGPSFDWVRSTPSGLEFEEIVKYFISFSYRVGKSLLFTYFTRHLFFVFSTILQFYNESTTISPEMKIKERTLIVKETHFKTNPAPLFFFNLPAKSVWLYFMWFWLDRVKCSLGNAQNCLS